MVQSCCEGLERSRRSRWSLRPKLRSVQDVQGAVLFEIRYWRVPWVKKRERKSINTASIQLYSLAMAGFEHRELDVTVLSWSRIESLWRAQEKFYQGLQYEPLFRFVSAKYKRLHADIWRVCLPTASKSKACNAKTTDDRMHRWCFHLHMLWNCCLKVSVEGNAWPRRENGCEEHVSKFLKDQEKALVSIRHFYAFLLLSLKLGQGLASRCFPSKDNQRQMRFFPELMTVKYKIRIYHSSLMEICGFERTSRFETSRQSRQNRQRRKSTCHPKSMCMRKMFRGDANAPAVLALKSKIHGYLDEVAIAVTNRAGPSILQITVTRLPAIGGLWSSGSSGPLKIVSRLFRLFGCRYWLALYDAARLRSWRNPWTRKRRVRYFHFGL